jgi:hypothetical protein
MVGPPLIGNLTSDIILGKRAEKYFLSAFYVLRQRLATGAHRIPALGGNQAGIPSQDGIFSGDDIALSCLRQAYG